MFANEERIKLYNKIKDLNFVLEFLNNEDYDLSEKSLSILEKDLSDKLIMYYTLINDEKCKKHVFVLSGYMKNNIPLYLCPNCNRKYIKLCNDVASIYGLEPGMYRVDDVIFSADYYKNNDVVKPKNYNHIPVIDEFKETGSYIKNLYLRSYISLLESERNNEAIKNKMIELKYEDDKKKEILKKDDTDINAKIELGLR